MKRLFKLYRNKLLIGILAGVACALGAREAVEYTSRDHFCEICHVHPHATESWKLSTHYRNPSGVIVHCVDCHLPPGGPAYLYHKIRLGGRDLYGKLFRDVNAIDWNERSKLEHALDYTFEAGCLKCHHDLFPPGLSERGATNHRQYQKDPGAKPCIDCHLHVGHFHEGDQFGRTVKANQEVFTESAAVKGFDNYTERIPGTDVEFEMVAIPGGTFLMGSPESEADRRPDEGPVRTVKLSPFWIERTEVTWEEYEAFYAATKSEGRSSDTAAVAGVDAVTGPTPPWGNPDQGWGRGKRPAITMSHRSATTYCQWLSRVTGKKYRLPTEAEWEYACRGGTKSAFFFDPGKTGEKPFAFYSENSGEKTHPPSAVAPNPFGLLNMPGNVCEFCLDWYDEKAYSGAPEGVAIVDPRGPEKGKEHVIRGGSFLTGLSELRSAARDYTRHDDWVKTDPQIPKSIWWYSDSIDVGFRVVCEGKQKESK
ncbi:MAG: SUMF1/EgtB/PvdO family nonheme iron enzyme [Phycisphaerae bacterium]|nr:SUMF1/EgtB/PvdO family nonheme iron enzyme [Phycisphaerae bacterium]